MYHRLEEVPFVEENVVALTDGPLVAPFVACQREMSSGRDCGAIRLTIFRPSDVVWRSQVLDCVVMAVRLQRTPNSSLKSYTDVHRTLRLPRCDWVPYGGSNLHVCFWVRSFEWAPYHTSRLTSFPRTYPHDGRVGGTMWQFRLGVDLRYYYRFALLRSGGTIVYILASPPLPHIVRLSQPKQVVEIEIKVSRAGVLDTARQFVSK